MKMLHILGVSSINRYLFYAYNEFPMEYTDTYWFHKCINFPLSECRWLAAKTWWLCFICSMLDQCNMCANCMIRDSIYHHLRLIWFIKSYVFMLATKFWQKCYLSHIFLQLPWSWLYTWPTCWNWTYINWRLSCTRVSNQWCCS